MPTTESQIYPSLLPLMRQAQAGVLLITANQRAARFLRHQYSMHMQHLGLKGWASPSILPWEAWLDSVWQQILFTSDEDRLLLTTAQEFQIWESIVDLPAAEGSLSALSVAELAQEAFQLLGDYSVDLARWRSASRQRSDWQTMHRWAARFGRLCEKSHWISKSTLPQQLTRALEEGKWQAPATIVLVGFDRFTPAQMGLISTMRRGSKIEQLNPIWRPTGPAFRAEARSAEAEMAAAADWARQQLASGVNRLAIISTSAGNIRGELGRTLDQCIGADQYSFSLGLPLAQYPLVKTALLLLRWSVEALSLTEASWLLLSPFFGGEVGPGELSTRARFDAHALRRGDIVQPQLSLTQFVRQMFRAISRSPAEWRALSSLLRSCEQALRFMQDANPRTRERNAYEWSEYFQRLLGIFQFPGKPSRDSKEFQTFKRWQQLLDQFAALAFDGSRMNATRAVQTLERLAGESIFQPETHEAPVQVMGPLEAAGSLFDGLWFLGANEMAWPLSGRPHPLLPWQLQREAAMLHSSPAADFAWSEQMTERLMKSAPNAVFSSAEQYGSEFARPSPLIEKFDRLVRGTRPGPQLVPAPQESKCKSFPDQPPLTWVKTRGSLYSSALRAQAACPFQAFATVRLECGLLDTPDDGLDAKQRGSLLHKLMQSVWTSPVEPDGLQNLQSLKQHLCDNTLRAFVSLHAEKIIKTTSPDPWEQQFFAVERERLTRLVCDWLQEVESRRPDFVVHETEKRFEDLEVGEAAFTVKIDRIDRLIADPVPQTDQREELILLDYKTGKTSCSTLSGERLEEPQLPLYATYALAEEPLVAVAFAQMRVDGMKFNGVSKREGILPNVGRGNETWASEMIGWREAVSNLTTDFVQGESRVDPSQGDQTCRLCDCGPLCRIAEIRKEAPREDDFD